MTSGSRPTSPDHDPEEPALHLDLKGLKCPLPVIRTRKRLASLAPGTRILVETTDPLAVIDIPHFCAEDGHRLESWHATDRGHSFLIRKGKTI
ncbi:tRNA 2-thiouridine synthesizing protein A [Rhizobium sp. PP-F2F-G38]|nr:tRNA 2-thiouridine synthesizing protein A [Rhizobium sp. PP-WC-1G-195]PYE98110.1 tRNA 2-thiouridine synthesizing protein A [Rhizobium sp. PP-F2F-G38]